VTTPTEHRLTAADGAEVFHRQWEPAGDVRGVVLIAHGASEHSARYDRFANELTEHGYATYALDHRGHGVTAESTGRGKLGAAGGAGLLTDLGQLRELATAEHADVPAFVFGHSMGSMIAQAYVSRYGDGLAGYVLSGCPGPVEGANEVIAAMEAAAEGGMGDEPIDMLGPFNEPFEPARTGYDWLSRDETEVDAYIADPLCGDDLPLTYAYVAAIIQLTAAMEPDAIAAQPRLPVLMVTGEMDAASAMAAQARELEKRLRDAGLDVTAKYYPEARHEVLNEINRNEVTADIVSWLEARS
jgi:alpha-beta hydrolase superfamily lysophospholipase